MRSNQLHFFIEKETTFISTLVNLASKKTLMKIKLQFFTVAFLLQFLYSNAQNVYYRTSSSEVYTENQYKTKVEKLGEQGRVQEWVLRTDVKQDSIIRLTRLGVQVNPGNFDPHAASKKQINRKFPIQNFVNSEKKNFERNHLEGKPTVINFWFTQCPPCIAEIPLLNDLVEKYGNQVNFITISFDDKGKIERFLKKQNFNFEHISNSKKQIDDLQIRSYPTTLILDKNGVAKFSYGDITYFIGDVNIILDGLL